MENLVLYAELLPIFIVGLVSGVVAYMKTEPNARDTNREVFKIFFTSVFLAMVVYAILTATDLPYLARVGISAGVGGLGIDGFLEIVNKILGLKNGNPDKRRDD